MNSKMPVLALACVLALSACSDKSSSPEAPGAAPSATASVPIEAPAPVAATPAAMPGDAMPAANGKPTDVVTDCATEIEGSGATQYNVSSIVVPATCSDFKITLEHTGKLPVTAMGHDVCDHQRVGPEGRGCRWHSPQVRPPVTSRRMIRA